MPIGVTGYFARRRTWVAGRNRTIPADRGQKKYIAVATVEGYSENRELVAKPSESVQENSIDLDCDFRSNVRLQDDSSTAFQVKVSLPTADCFGRRCCNRQRVASCPRVGIAK